MTKANDKDKSPSARATKEMRLASLLLSALMLTDDDDLAKLRKQRIGRQSEVDLKHLRRVRDILDELHSAIQADDASRWQRVHEAHKALVGPRPVAALPTDGTQAPVPPPPVPGPARAVAAPKASATGSSSPWGQKPAAVAADPSPPRPSSLQPELSVVAYAALCAASRALPERVATIEHRYGLPDEASRAQLDEAWSRRLAGDERLAELCELLQAQFSDWLERHPPG